MFELDTIQIMDCLDGLRQLPDACIDSCVTSPPYWHLRDYGIAGQIGQETTPEEYVAVLVQVFEEVRRVLKANGTLWLNLGDTYATSRAARPASGLGAYNKGSTNLGMGKGINALQIGLKEKDLIGIPWTVALSLRAAGWYLRQDIIWAKPNCMPESVRDRCTKSHEYIFLLAKSPKYYFDADAIKTPLKPISIQRYAQDIERQKGSNRVPGKTNGPMKASLPGLKKRNPRQGVDVNGGNQASETGIPVFSKKYLSRGADGSAADSDGSAPPLPKANKRSVWTVSSQPFKEAHFATFPPGLIEDCVKAGCPVGGVVLDPFMGAGTTALVSASLGRHFLGFELNKDFVEIAKRRLKRFIGKFDR